MGGTVAAGLCYTSRPQDDSGAFSDSGEREGGRASYRSSFCLYEGGRVLYSIYVLRDEVTWGASPGHSGRRRRRGFSEARRSRWRRR